MCGRCSADFGPAIDVVALQVAGAEMVVMAAGAVVETAVVETAVVVVAVATGAAEDL